MATFKKDLGPHLSEEKPDYFGGDRGQKRFSCYSSKGGQKLTVCHRVWSDKVNGPTEGITGQGMQDAAYGIVNGYPADKLLATAKAPTKTKGSCFQKPGKRSTFESKHNSNP